MTPEITLTPLMFLIVCPMLFLAGFVDSIGGGGGIISLPAYIFAGLPPHLALGTNKSSVVFGAFTATARVIKRGLLDFKLAFPGIIAAFAGANIGARISLILSEKVLLYMMIIVLPLCAFVVMNKKMFDDESGSGVDISRSRLVLTVIIASFVIGIYDGLYGPGTGTFLLIVMRLVGKVEISRAVALKNTINFVTNLSSLVVFLMNGTVILPLALTAAVFNMAGSYIGTGMVLSNGSKIVRPVIVIVLVLLFIKIIGELL